MCLYNYDASSISTSVKCGLETSLDSYHSQQQQQIRPGVHMYKWLYGWSGALTRYNHGCLFPISTQHAFSIRHTVCARKRCTNHKMQLKYIYFIAKNVSISWRRLAYTCTVYTTTLSHSGSHITIFLFIRRLVPLRICSESKYTK